MIEYIRKEPLFTRAIKLILAWLIITSVIISVLHYHYISQLYSNNTAVMQQLAGDIAQKYPKTEIDILKTVTGKADKKSQSLGRKIFAKYGYNDEKVFENKSFKGFFNKFYISDITIFLLNGIIVLLLLMWIFSKLYIRINGFSFAINRIIEGDFSVGMNYEQEGLFAGVIISFEQMAKRVCKSIDELKKEKENIKGLISDISHQLKTPIASIKLFYTLLSDEELEEGDKKYFLEQGKYEVKRLEELASGLLKISRLEAGMIELKTEMASLNDTICDAVNSVMLKAMDKEIEINIGNLGDYTILHDLKWTREALFNILDNAVKYTPLKGKIDISAEKMASCIRIDIEDNGIGIATEEYTQIFKRFYRGKSEYVKKEEGSGIGLYLTRKILEQQGGSITVNSMEGMGTKFSVFLQNC